MTLLLDTHALIWALREPEKLSAKARAALGAASGWAVSAASLYEIALKGSLGKWPEVTDLVGLDLDARLRAEGLEVIAASGRIMQRAGSFESAHRDPFDRIIAASALEGNLDLLSKDETLDVLAPGRLRRVW